MFRIAFHAPEIPPNTGNAIRLAANTGAELHLVEPLGFALDERNVRRAGLDYHELADLRVHRTYEELEDATAPARILAFTTTATRLYTEIAYAPGDVLLFGSESVGLPLEIQARATDRVRIPMVPGSRSLNLANAAAVAVYEAWRQHSFPTGAPPGRRG